jgi:hypothetical protein
MFRRLINNNVKIIGIRRLSNDINNHKIVKELDKVNRTLNYIYLNTFILNIVTCITAINH